MSEIAVGTQPAREAPSVVTALGKQLGEWADAILQNPIGFQTSMQILENRCEAGPVRCQPIGGLHRVVLEVPRVGRAQPAAAGCASLAFDQPHLG